MKKNLMIALCMACHFGALQAAHAPKTEPVDLVNPFIGTSNLGTTNPGAICPNGLMSVVPFNVMGSDENKCDKDSRWWSTPYEFHNVFFTGFSHVNLSGVGCPDVGSLLLMPTTGKLNVDYKAYGSHYKDEVARPGYYSNFLVKHGVKTEVTATLRTACERFTFPKGESHLLLNLGEGLTKESGAMVKQVSPTEYEGMKLQGAFCYYAQAVFPIYFVMRVNKVPQSAGYWKKQRERTGKQAEWFPDRGQYKLYTAYQKEMAGDDIGVYMNFNTTDNEVIEVQMGVSFVSIANARENLNAEQKGKDFNTIAQEARQKWNADLSRIEIEGGTKDQQTIFYTALYHTLIHPNILQDVNGQYPAMESNRVLTQHEGNRYTVFSLWDTYRNLHQFMTLVYPNRQRDMVKSMISMYDESGWLPKWELFGRETYTMEGDPSIPVIVDCWLKGLRGYDINKAYTAMKKGATTDEKSNPLRPDNNEYVEKGYISLRDSFDNSVSHALEYYIADNALSRLAAALGHKADAKLFYNRSMGYRNYFSKEFNMLRPILPNGKFYSPFNPLQGANWEPSPGFHEGNAWNYTFYVPHDIYGLAKLMGGKKRFIEQLQSVFDRGNYDPTNEPNIAYPFLFSYFKGEEWRTQVLTHQLLQTYFKNSPEGLPGNDDTGTMSAWALFSMMGFYPDCPGEPAYTLTSPVFDKITLHLDAQQWGKDKLVIETQRSNPQAVRIEKMEVGGQPWTSYRIRHSDLVKAGTLKFILK